MSKQQQRISCIPPGMCQHREQLLLTHIKKLNGQANARGKVQSPLERLRRLVSNSRQPGKPSVGSKRKLHVEPDKGPVEKKSRCSSSGEPNKKEVPPKVHPAFNSKKQSSTTARNDTSTELTRGVEEKGGFGAALVNSTKSTVQLLHKPPSAKGPQAAERRGNNTDQVRPRSAPENVDAKQIILLDGVQSLKPPRDAKRGPKSVEQKVEFRSTPVNFAKRKIELLGKLGFARSCRDVDGAKRIQDELAKIEKMAQALEQQRKTQSAQRNKVFIAIKVTRNESPPALPDEFHGLEPYIRKKTNPFKICGLKDPAARAAILNALDERYSSTTHAPDLGLSSRAAQCIDR